MKVISNITFNQTEFEQVNRIFLDSGKKRFRTFLRELVLSQSKRIVFQSPLNKEVRLDISRMGNNLNQIAHQMNAQVGTVSYTEIKKKIGQIQEDLRQIRMLIEKL